MYDCTAPLERHGVTIKGNCNAAAPKWAPKRCPLQLARLGGHGADFRAAPVAPKA